MYEEIISFVKEVYESYPFAIQMTGISYCDGTYRIERRNSPIYCFEYIIKGEGTVNVNGNRFTPVQGDVYILPKGSDHIYYSDSKNPWEKIWFNIEGPLIDNLMQAYKLNNIYHIENLDLSELFHKMFNNAQEKSRSQKEVFQKASIIFHEILLAIYSRTEKRKKSYNEIALQLKQYIDKNLENKLTIKNLSNQVFRSPSQIIRIFKEEFGLTPYDYILSKKLETAELLLLNTNLPIKQIALKLKFADEHYFSNYFKAKTGVAPTGYRKGDKER
jgi:AraC-like DNA-binding protein